MNSVRSAAAAGMVVITAIATPNDGTGVAATATCAVLALVIMFRNDPRDTR